jgi:chromosome segregation ATPase
MRVPVCLVLLFLGISLFSSLLQAKTKDTDDQKKMCAQTQEQIRVQQAKKKKMQEERTPLEDQFLQAKKKYQDSQSRLQGQSHCSKGRPDNSAECEAILSSMRQGTAEMDGIQDKINKMSAEMLEVDVELDKGQQLLNAYSCH